MPGQRGWERNICAMTRETAKKRRKDALNDYKNGLTYDEIATKYKVSKPCVQKWYKENGWSKYESKHADSLHQRKIDKRYVRVDKNETKNKITKAVVNTLVKIDTIKDKQQEFCLRYTQSFNAVSAYMQTYKTNYSSALAASHRLMQDENIIRAIKRLKRAKFKAMMLTTDDIVLKQMQIAFASISDYIHITKEAYVDDNGLQRTDSNGTPLYFNRVWVRPLDEVDASLISEVKQDNNGVSIKLKDSQKALDWLTEYYMINPMAKHKVEFDNAKLELERRKNDILQGDVDNATIVKLEVGEP